MMNSLSRLFASLHEDLERQLSITRESLRHPSAKGDESESIWLALLQNYLPTRYRAERAQVVDSEGQFSDQIDVVVFDRQYSPFIFQLGKQRFVPAESVYAVFEAKQSIGPREITYAKKKICSVRALFRTSLPIPHAGGEYKPKPLTPIIGGVLSLESNWNPPLGEPLRKALETNDPMSRIDIGCIASRGLFHSRDGAQTFEFHVGCKTAARFLLRLISELQRIGTVQMIDIMAYERWLVDDR